VIGGVLALQVLTNLAFSHPGPGLPGGWTLERVRHVGAPEYSVTRGHALRVEANAQAGFAVHRLHVPLRPAHGELTWRWRTETPLHHASLRSRERDDSPARVFLVFDDGRRLYYSWGNAEAVGDTFRSWTGNSRAVIVLRRGEDANGSWYIEKRDPFEDYRRAFDHAPHAIVAVGVGADTDQLHDNAAAEVGDISWE
jgi:hypothetical protein